MGADGAAGGGTQIVRAPAKLNLYMHVCGRRDDGYHDLDSLVVFAGVHDLITVEPGAGLSLEIDGPFADAVPADGTNLVIRAAEVLAELAGVDTGAAIRLTKNLPVASGIGGGSADAAAAIKALVRHWGIHPATHDLSGMALELGADVPVCLFGRGAFMGGVGERLEDAPELPDAALVLVNPGAALSTPEVFGARRGEFSAPARFEDDIGTAAELADVLRARGNDLTEAAVALAPGIADVLNGLAAAEACLLARMSGSGATCFGLFAGRADAEAAAIAIGAANPGWWVTATRLRA